MAEDDGVEAQRRDGVELGGELPQVLAREVGDEMVLLEMASGEMYSLNPVGAHLWKRLEAGDEIESLATGVVAEWDVDLETAQADVDAFLAEMRGFGLVDQ